MIEVVVLVFGALDYVVQDVVECLFCDVLDLGIFPI